MAKIGLSSPWVLYYHEVEAFFKSDSEIKVVFDEENNVLKLYVDNMVKADALSQLLPEEKQFGKVTLNIEIIPSNEAQERTSLKLSNIKSNKALLIEALKGNSSIQSIVEVKVYTNPVTYVIFKPEIIQYFTDDLSDAHGICSTLNQEIAKDIFENIDGVYYCTDKVSSITTGVITVTPNNYITCSKSH